MRFFAVVLTLALVLTACAVPASAPAPEPEPLPQPLLASPDLPQRQRAAELPHTLWRQDPEAR